MLAKKRSRSKASADFGFSDAQKMIGGTVVFGTTALLGSQLFGALKR